AGRGYLGRGSGPGRRAPQGSLDQLAVLSYQRRGETLVGVHELVGKAAAMAELAVMEALVLVVHRGEDLVVLGSQGELAAGAAVGADRLGFVESPPARLELEGARDQGPDRADRDAGSAELAV